MVLIVGTKQQWTWVFLEEQCVLVFIWVKGSEQQAVGSKRSSGTVNCETFGG